MGSSGHIDAFGGADIRLRFVRDPPHKTGIFEHVGPLAVGTSVAILDVLAHVVGTVKLLGNVAYSEFVNLPQMAATVGAVLIGWVPEDDIFIQGTCAR